MPAASSDPTRAAGPTRRSLLRVGLLALGVTAVAGCTDGRPRTPWSPDPDVDGDERLPPDLPPDGELLLLARERLHRYRAVLTHVRPVSRTGRSVARHLDEVWTVQQDRLEQLLVLGGVDLPALAEVTVDLPDAAPSSAPPQDDAATSTGPEDAAATSAPPGLAPEVLGAQIRSDLAAALEGLSRSTVTNRAVLASLLAQHSESARLLQAPVRHEPLVGPVGAAAVPVLQVTRPAVFGLEVVAARSRGEERALYESVLQPLQRITRSLTSLAGEAAPVPPLGYDLPEPLDDEASRMALARALVADVAPAALPAVGRAGSDVGQLRSVVRIVAESASWSRELGVDGAPFPGMTLP